MDLEVEVKRLQNELEKSRNEATTAAELGMSLLQANEELRDQMERDSKAYAEQIEVGIKTVTSNYLNSLFFIVFRLFSKTYIRWH